MAIKLLLLKSGEDMIADVKEMTFGEGDKTRVVGYSLNRPCVIKMREPNIIPEMEEGNIKKAGYEVSLFPWIPLSAEEDIPIPCDWVVTMVEPTFKLKDDGTLEPWLISISRQDVFMISSDKILTITEPMPTLVEKYESLTK